MWNELEKPWQEAFDLAWQAYKRGTIPIGCVIVNESGDVISRGRNRIMDIESKNPLAGTDMAHAEMTAMLGLKEEEHPNIRKYTLYTTMEPCPMCFGTIVMMSIRNLVYGARDNFAGAAAINERLEYIKNKRINITRASEEIEAFQLILACAYEYERQHPRVEVLFNSWREINHLSMDLGKMFYEGEYFKKASKESKIIAEIYDEVIGEYIKIRGDRNGK